MVSHPETGSDSPIGSDRDRGRHTADCQGGNSPAGPSLSPTVHMFKGGYCLVPAATVLIV